MVRGALFEVENENGEGGELWNDVRVALSMIEKVADRLTLTRSC